MAGTELIDRSVELERLDALLSPQVEGFSALELAGAAGIGKTALWAHARRMAESRGFTTLSARPNETAAKGSFGAVADLLFPTGAELLDTLPRPQRDALEVALLRSSHPRRRPLHRAVAAGLLGLVRQLADTQPLLVAVDDWQWLDPPSRDALEFVARRLEGEAVRLVYSLRTPTAAGGLSGVVTDERLTRLTLTGLDLAGIARLVNDRLGQALPRPQLVRISECTAGNPFHVIELARALVEHGPHIPAGAALPVPDNLRELLLARVARLPRRSRDALALVAALSHPTTALVGTAELLPAEEAGIVDVEPDGRVVFSHPLFAAVVQGSLSTAHRRRVHAQAAELVEDPEQRARHLALAAVGPDREVATQLDDATRMAGLRGAPDAAAELSELAAALTPPSATADRQRRLVRAAQLLLDVGDLERADRLLGNALELETSNQQLARALQVAGQLAGHRSDWSASVEFAMAARRQAEGQADLLAAIECDLAFACVSLGALPDAIDHGRAAAQYAATVGDDGIQAMALAVLTMVEFMGGGGVGWDQLQRALELEDPDRADGLSMRPSFIAGLLTLWTGDARAAATTLTRLHDELLQRGREGVAPNASIFIVWAQLWTGDFSAAARTAAQAQASAALLQDRGVTAAALTSSALVHAHTGETAAARSEAEQALELFAELQWFSAFVWPNWALGVAALGDDDPARVHSLLGPLAAQVSAMGAGDPVLGMFVPDEVEALIALGEIDRAQELLAWFESRAERVDRDWALALAARCHGELAAHCGDLDAASAAFEAALAAHERCPIPFDRARTLLAAGRCYRRAKRRRAAVESLDAAAREFQELGAAGWAARTRGELGRVGRRTTARDSLTESERLIAELAASGLTNREVAERAFVSVKTVEANLTRVYRKLGIRSRVGLVNALET